MVFAVVPLEAGSILFALYWLLSLIWLFIAHEPETEPVSPQHLNTMFAGLAILIVFNRSSHYLTHYRPPVYKSKIVFNDLVIAMQDSMLALRHLCTKVDSSQSLSCYVRSRDSVLVVVGPQRKPTESTVEELGRVDTVAITNKGLRHLNNGDKDRFLNHNLIEGVRYDASIGFWLYNYGVTVQDGDEGRRDVCIYDTPADTLHPAFHYYLSTHDRRQRIVLVGHNDVPSRFFN